jgi:hypothetical protein
MVALAIASAGAASAQDGEEERVLEVGKWYPTVETGVSLTQSSYSDNWAGGDRGSIVWTWILNATLENQLSDNVNTLNTLKLAFGQTHQQVKSADGSRSWDRPEKTTDLIDFETLWRLMYDWPVDPFVAGRFESQFQDASDPFGRTIALNPLKFKETAGLAHEFFETEEDRSMLVRVGFSLRQSSRKLFEGPPPGDETFTETANDGGLEWTTDYKTKVLDDRVSWTSKLTVYQPFYYSGKDELESLSADSLAVYGLDSDVDAFTTTVDIDFENIFTTQITKLLSVSLYTKLVYDKYDNTVAPEANEAGDGLLNAGDVKSAIRKAGQFKQTLSVGLIYRF